MPTVLVKIPKGSFPGESRARMVRQINEAAATAEQMPDDPRKRAMCWVLVEETEPGTWTCGAADLSARVLTCMALVYLPAGVLDEASRRQYVELMHAAFQGAMPAGDKRRLATSVVLFDVADQTWGVNGALWGLADFTHASGYAHLRHLVPAAGVGA